MPSDLDSSPHLDSVPSEQGSIPPAAPPHSLPESTPDPEALGELDENTAASRQQPIPPPTEDRQYRAIGLIQGRYFPSQEHFTRGRVITEEGTELDAVLLGRVIHLVRKRLDHDQEHLWVVYPRTRENEGQLHIQIMGVWAPEEMGQPFPTHPTPKTVPNYFSIRGEVVFQSQDPAFAIVKIRRAQSTSEGRPAAFNLRLEGQLPQKGVGRFWDLEVYRQGSLLQIESATPLGVVAKPRPRRRPVDRPTSGKGLPRPQFPNGAVDRPQGRSSRLPKPILKGKQ